MNTLVVTVDAVRADHLGQYGYERDTFPAADRLLRSGGMQFENAFANGVYTGISLPSMLTSRYAGDDAVRAGPTVATALPDDVTTHAIHSNTFFSTKFDDIEGFDTYQDFFGRSDHDDDIPLVNRVARRVFDTLRPRLDSLGLLDTAQSVQEAVLPPSLIHEVAVFEDAETITDEALARLDATDGDCFLWVHYMDPHRPYAINAESPEFAPELERTEIISLMARAGVKPEQIAPDDRRLLIDLYDSAIRYTSDQVARLFDGLDESGLWDETAVILTADHGEEFGEHGRYFHRNRPYDELLHVPMFLRTPEMDTSTTVDADRELLDVAPTVCRLHGVDAPEEFLGAALRDSRERRPIATGSFRDDGPVVGARWDGWKYIDVDGVPELFDLGDDPGEQTNVAAEHPAVCRRYRDRIPDALLETEADGVPDASDVDSETQRRLEELGYLE